MDIKMVNSSNLQALGYDAQAQTLLVVFKSGRRYLYSGVPELEYRALMAASSHGAYFNANVRYRYAFSELSPGDNITDGSAAPPRAAIFELLIRGFRKDISAPALFA